MEIIKRNINDKVPIWFTIGETTFSGDSVKRYIEEQEGKKPFEYDIYECPEELKGQLKLGDFFG